MHAEDGIFGAAYADASLSHPAGEVWTGFAEFTAGAPQGAVLVLPLHDTYLAYFVADTGVVETE